MPVDKLSIQEFAQKIKQAHPEYKDVNDTILSQKIVAKFPQYAERVDLSGIPTTTPIDKGIRQTDQTLNQPIQFNGTFQPDLEGEKNGLYLNDPDYQKQKQEFTQRIITDPKGNLLYPEKDDKTGQWMNYYTKQPLPNFDPQQMQGGILQVPKEYLTATGGKQFISPVYNKATNAYSFPGVETPSVPHLQPLPEATVYGKKNNNYVTNLSPDEEQKYQQWKQKLPGELKNDNDYDLRGQYKENPNVEPSERMHLTDTYKKPNHITFSDESKYNDPANGIIGGHWDTENGKDVFYASQRNIDNAGGLPKLQEYFKNYEPQAKLYLPDKNGNPLKTTANIPTPFSKNVQSIVDESKKEGGQFDQVLKNNPELAGYIDNTLKKYGAPYAQSLGTGNEGMSNVVEKAIEDKYNLNQPLPNTVDPNILNSHLNVLNNFEKNRQQFEATQQDLQHQADLITDRAKRTGQSVSSEDADALAKKAADNIQKWNAYTKSVQFSQNYVNQPKVQQYLNEFKKRQSGLQLIDEVRQRAFPKAVNDQMKQDAYDRKAIEGKTNAWDYTKTALGSAAKGVSNIGESVLKAAPGMLPLGNIIPASATNAMIESLNNKAQQFIGANLPSISPEGIEQMNKRGIGHMVNDIASTLGGFAPYIVPGFAEEGLAQKGATFATALAESMPTVRKEAEKQGLTGSAYNTFITLKPLVNAAFMTLLPNAKFAKGFDNDVAKAIVDGEFNNPKQMLINLAKKVTTVHPEDVAHLQAMLSGTALGDAVVNKVTNALQAGQDIQRGISRKEELPVELSGMFNPRQTAVMALAGKILETIPTLKNFIGDYNLGKETAETYNNIQNNLIELAGHNLEGVSKKVDELAKKDPGNIYAQHLKNTLQDYAYAEARMPEGLEPEQKAALFDIQKQISQKQRQIGNADPSYQPHIQKNVDELNKLIPDILKDPKKANDYLKDAHKELEQNILSPQMQTNEEAETATDSQAEGQSGQIIEKSTEGAETNEPPKAAAPSFLESRHADTVDDEKGLVSGPNDNPISKEGRKDANDLAEEVKDKGVTKIITSDLERAKQTGRIVADKTGANIENRPELNTWDIGDFDKSSDEEFKKAQEYFVKHPNEKEFEGKKINESFNEYKDRIIKARTELEKEPASTLVVNHSNNMMLWEAYAKNGHKWDEKSADDYLNSKTPEPATLVQASKPRVSVSTPNIVNVKLKKDAVQERRREEVLQREQGENGSSGSGRGRVEPSQQGERPTGESESIKKESEDKGKEKVDDELPFIEEEGDNDFTSTKNAITNQKIEDAGLQKPMEEAARDFGKVWKQGQDKLNKGFDIEDLLKTLAKKPRAVTDLENAMILFHQNVKESQLFEANKDLDKARKDNDRDEWNDAYNRRAKLLDDLQDIYNVDKSIGRETARGLNARKMMADRRFSLVNMQLEKRASNGGEPLSDTQMEELKKQYEDIKQTKQVLDKRVEELEKENARLTAEKEISGEKRSTGRSKKTKEQFKQERKDIVQRMRDDLLKAAKGGEGLTSSIPLAAQLKAVAPHIKDLVKSFVEEGIDSLEDITKNIKDILKPSIPDIEDRHIHDLIAGEYNEPKPKKEGEPSKEAIIKQAAKVQKYRTTDPQLMKAQADYERAKDKYEQGLKKDQLKERTKLQKGQDVFLKYERFAKLSNPITLGKLAMAAITRMATTPLEEGIGAVYSKALPGIAKKAPGEAGFHVKALAKGYKAAFMRGLDDAATVAKGGKTDIEAIFGKKGELPPEALDFFGQLHSAIKAPVKRFAFERSFEKRMANNIKNGTPIDAMVEARIAMEAYKDAQRSIFMQDNVVSKGWTRAMSALEKSGDTGKLAATISQWLIPFVKVPTNILGETISHVAGPEIALGKIIATGLGKGLKNLSQEESEMIMRNLKKGTIGHVALLAGFLNPQSFGGYYQKDDKRKPGDVKAGDMRIGDTNIPAWALEAPLFQAMQLGATVRRMADKMTKGKPNGIGVGLLAGAAGLFAHEPLLDEPQRVMESLQKPNSFKYFTGELVKSSLVPAMLDYAAKVTDPADKHSTFEKIIEPDNKRQPNTIGEHIESAVPGLRENIGVKKPTGGHRQRAPHR